jgi:hypothetical protein
MTKPTTTVADVLRHAQIDGTESAVEIKVDIDPPHEEQKKSIALIAGHPNGRKLAARMRQCSAGTCTCSSGACWYGERAEIGPSLCAPVFELVTSTRCVAQVFVDAPDFTLDTIDVDLEYMREFELERLSSLQKEHKIADLRAIGLFIPVLHIDSNVPNHWGLGLQLFIGARSVNPAKFQRWLDAAELEGDMTTAEHLDFEMLIRPPDHIVVSDKQPDIAHNTYTLATCEAQAVEMWLHRMSGMQRLFTYGIEANI